jgi:hypothetical protein
MKSNILRQLALNTNLLPDELSQAILDGKAAASAEIVFNLLLHSIDCQAMTCNDPKSTWTEKRLARQSLVIAFLLALGQE